MRRTTRRAGFALVALALTALFATVHATTAAARPWLGVYTQEVTSELRDGLGLPQDAGVIVNRVVAGGPAERAGLRQGDVIVRFNSRAVESPQELAELVGGARDGQEVSLEVLHHGIKRSLTVTLSARPEDEDAPAAPPAPHAPPAPPAPGDDDGDRAHRDVRVKLYTHGDGDGPQEGRVKVYRDGQQPQEFRLDGDLQQLPGHLRTMLRDLPGLDGNGGLHALRVMGAGRGRLGVRIESLNADLAAALGAPDDDGVLVLEVMPGTPAERAGLRSGDVILTVEGKDVKNAESLVEALRDVDGKVSMTVSRKGARRTVEAELAAASQPDREDRPVQGQGRKREVEQQFRLRDRQDADSGDLRQQLEELRQQLRELRHQLEDRHHE